MDMKIPMIDSNVDIVIVLGGIVLAVPILRELIKKKLNFFDRYTGAPLIGTFSFMSILTIGVFMALVYVAMKPCGALSLDRDQEGFADFEVSEEDLLLEQARKEYLRQQMKKAIATKKKEERRAMEIATGEIGQIMYQF